MTDDLTTRLLAAIERAEQEGAKRSCGVVHPQFDTNHPEGHPDEAVLRHCAAHRKIVDGYRDMQKAMDEAPVASRAFVRVALDVYEVVIEALAEGYDLTTEPAP